MEERKTVEHSIPLDILDDLSSRFIINVPEGERQNLIRICFQIELAHWFYLDFYCQNDPATLKSCGMQEFAAHIFHHIPFLKPHSSKLSKVLEEWREYKQSVPTYGAILVSDDMNHVLLVQSYWAKNSWSFPKGKVNEDEDPSRCAAREVFEETGFDITPLMDPNEFIESVINDQLVRLYIVCGISKDTKFQPRTRYEIKSCEWFLLSDLPSNKNDNTPKIKMGVRANAFFNVFPFVKRLKRWVYERQQKNSTCRRQRIKSAGDADSVTKPKSTSKQPLTQPLNASDIQPYDSIKTNSPVPSNSAKKRLRKPRLSSRTKRQLFNENENGDCTTATKVSESELTAPAWLNFKFNRRILLESLNL